MCKYSSFLFIVNFHIYLNDLISNQTLRVNLSCTVVNLSLCLIKPSQRYLYSVILFFFIQSTNCLSLQSFMILSFNYNSNKLFCDHIEYIFDHFCDRICRTYEVITEHVCCLSEQAKCHLQMRWVSLFLSLSASSESEDSNDDSPLLTTKQSPVNLTSTANGFGDILG